MERRRLTPQEQLDVIRDVKLGMSRAHAMKKYNIRWHSTLSQIISRRGHQVKVVRAAPGHPASAAAAAALQKAVRNGTKTQQAIRCFIRKPQIPHNQISHIDPRTAMSDQPASQTDAIPVSQPKKQICALPLRLRVQRPLVRRATGHMSTEEKIDEALSRISKLNQKLMLRQGSKVVCTCCDREINFKINTVMARVREHSVTRSHTVNISRTRQQRQQDRGGTGQDTEQDGSEEEPVNGTAEPAGQLTSRNPVRFAFQSRRRRGGGRGHNRSLGRRVAAPPVPTIERQVLRQQEFERELITSFLQTGIPVHKLNMAPLRDLLKKWTGNTVPRFEEKQLDYGF